MEECIYFYLGIDIVINIEMIEAFDFLPADLNVYVKILIYTLILVHILAFTIYFIIACPAFFKKNESFSDKV